MKYDFTNLNIEPMPNPKPIKVQRVWVYITTEEGKKGPPVQGVITNANLHPRTTARGW